MENNLYRKNAMERISSPEQLNEYMKVAGPVLWCFMGGLAAVFAAFFIWGVLGSIPETVEISGIALAPGDSPLAVYAYLPINDTKALSEGMQVRVSPDYAPREQFGYIYGEIKNIGDLPVSTNQLFTHFGHSIQFLNLPTENSLEVVVGLETRQDGSLRWSSSKGENINVTIGSNVSLTVITIERKPIDLLLK